MFSRLLSFPLILGLVVWPFGADKGGVLQIKKSAYDLPADPQQFAFIKILIESGSKEITIQTDKPFQVLDAEKRVLFQGARLAPSHVAAKGDSIQIGTQPFHSNPLIVESPAHGVKIRGAWYRQALEIWRESSGRLTIINVLPIEDYLRGVLPSEVNPKWSMESLKAQAIASRTYALFKMIENQNERYHLSKDVLSQVYGGKNLEHSMTNQAVEDTQGQILVGAGNKVFPAYFHSTCGGRTTHAEYIWPVEPNDVLKGVECNFCWKSPHYRWEAEFSMAEIEKKLQSHIKVSGITGISIGEKDETGRAKYFVLETKSGKVNVHSNDFRIWVSPMKLKSTWIQGIGKKAGNFYFKGRGWGHGVGLCQYGTKQLGEMGYSAGKILAYYYPGTQIVQYWTEQPRSITTTVKGLLARVKEKLDLE